MTKDQDKAEELNAFVASVANSKTCYSLGTQPLVLVDKDGEQNKPFMIQDEIVLDLLRKLDARVHGARWTAPYLSARVGYGMDNVGIN